MVCAINTSSGLSHVTSPSLTWNAPSSDCDVTKILLRHPLAVSSMEELANGTFEPVIGEIDEINPKNVKRVVLCSGKSITIC